MIVGGEIFISDRCLYCGLRAVKVMPSERSIRIWDPGILSRKRAFNSAHLLFRTLNITRTGKWISWTGLVTAVNNTSFNVWLYFTLDSFANIKFLGLFRAYQYSRFTRPSKPFPDQRIRASMLCRARNKQRAVHMAVSTSIKESIYNH